MKRIALTILFILAWSSIAISDVTVPAGTVTKYANENLNRMSLYKVSSIYLADTSANTMLVNAPALANDSNVFTFPPTLGTNKYVLITDGAGATSWAQVDLTAAVTGVLPPDKGGTGVANNAAATLTRTGNHALTLTTTNTTDVTLPTTGTLAVKSGDAFTGPSMTSFLEFDHQASDAATPGSASNDVRLFAKSKKLYTATDDGAGTAVIQEIGAGAGGGEINYLSANSDFESGTTTGWAEFDDGSTATPVDCAGGTASNIALTAQGTTKLRGNFSAKVLIDNADAQGEGVSFAFKVPEPYRQTYSKISFAVKTDADFTSGEWGIWVYNSDSSLLITPERVTTIPSSTTAQVITAYWTPSNSTDDDYSLCLMKNTATAGAEDELYLDDFVVGPGPGPISGLAGQNCTTFTPVWKCDTATWTMTSTTGSYCRTGDRMSVYAYARMGAAPNIAACNAAGRMYLDLPFTADLTKAADSAPLKGSASMYSSSTGKVYGAQAQLSSSTQVNLVEDSAAGTTLAYWTGDGDTAGNNLPVGQAFADTEYMRVELSEIPVSGWDAGVYLSQEGVEYASNTCADADDAAGDSDTTNMVAGPSGAQFANIDSTTDNNASSCLVQFTSTIQPTDTLLLECWNGYGWNPCGESNYVVAGRFQNHLRYYGMRIAGASGTTATIYFGNAGRLPSGDGFDTNGAPWSDIDVSDTYKWRVKKFTQGAVGGFNVAQGGTGAGLLNYYNEATVTDTMTNVANTTAITYKIRRVNNQVTLSLETNAGGNNKPNTSIPGFTTALPSWARPTVTLYVPWLIADNSADSIGFATVASNGAVNFYRANSGSWTSGAPATVYVGSVTYSGQ